MAMKGTQETAVWSGLALLALLAGISEGRAQMFVHGKAAVSDSGSFQYQIPIPAVPGVAGMQPQLTLNYSSQAGNGLLGVGWSIGGLSSVARCPRNWAQDGKASNGRVPYGVQFNSSDALCLDGQRLFQVSATSSQGGTELRTEFEGFNRVIAFGSDWHNPDWIQVEERSGLISTYGYVADSPNSRLEATSGSTTWRQWARSSVRDRLGHKMTISYAKNISAGDFRPISIQYNWSAGGTPTTTGAQVVFNYQGGARPDVQQTGVWGSILKNSYLIDSIDTNVLNGTSATRVTHYQMLYSSVPAGEAASLQTSLLSQLIVCAGPSTATCLPAVSFTYGGSGDSPNLAEVQAVSQSITWTDRIIPADFAAEGIDSLLVTAGMQCHTYGTCWDGWKWFRWDKVQHGYYLAASAVPSISTHLYNAGIAVGDFSGSGKPGFIAYGDQASNGSNYTVFLSTGSGFSVGPSGMNTFVGGYIGGQNNENVYVGDFFGDGRIEILTNSQAYNDGTHQVCYDHGELAPVCATYAYGYTGWKLFQYSSSGLSQVASGQSGLSVGQRAIVARFTGESASQILVTPDSNVPYQGAYGLGAAPSCTATPGWQLYNFDGTNLVAISSGLFAQNSGFSDIYPGNFGGDGLASLLVVPHWYQVNPCTNATLNGSLWTQNGGWYLYRATGNGFALGAGGSSPTPTPVTGTQFIVGDFNGDGRDGVLLLGNALTNVTTAGWTLMASDGQKLIAAATGTWPSWGETAIPGSLFPQSGSGLLLTSVAGAWSGFRVWNSTWTQPRFLLTSINNQQTTINVTYQPLNATGVHTPSIGSVYPIVDVNPSTPVVTQYTVSNGIVNNGVQGVLTNTYSYAGLKADLTGRGLLGFGSMTTVQADSNLKSVKSYSQTFPFTGATIGAVGYVNSLQTSNAVNTFTAAIYPLQGTASTTNCTSDGQTACPALSAGYRYFVYPSWSLTQGWDLDGSPGLPVTTTHVNSSADGTETSTAVSTPDGTSTTTAKVYSSDIANWLLGRIKSQTVTAVTP